MKMTAITEDNINDIITDIESNLELLGEYLNLNFIINKPTYSKHDFEFSVRAFIKGTPNPTLYKNSKPITNSNLIGTKLKIKGTIYEVIRIDVRKYKYPIIARNTLTKRTFKISHEQYNQFKI